MKIVEKVYCAFFVFTVLGATVYLNKSKSKTTSVRSNISDVVEFAAYDSAKESIKLIEDSIEVGGDLEINYIKSYDGITLLWNRLRAGNNTYEIYINDSLLKTIKSEGKELYYTVVNSNFLIGNNTLSIKTLDLENKLLSGELFLNFVLAKEKDIPEISFSE